MKKLNILFAILILGLFSCEDWLDIQPRTDIGEGDMFADSRGFYSVLNGIYTGMSETTLYGQELSWGAIDAWAGYYKLNSSLHKTYLALRDFEYGNSDVKGLADNIWNKLYRLIADCNNLIQHTEICDSTHFTYGSLEKNLILGEAYALRAFLHFDLLRIFAKSPLLDNTSTYIPYVEKFPSKVNPSISNKELLNKIIDDLLKGKQLVATYDTLDENRDHIFNKTYRLNSTVTPKWGRFYNNRGHRLNYLAVTALLSRVYLYADKKDQAYDHAYEIIRYVEDNELKFTPIGNIKYQSEDKRDRKFSDGVLFGLYNEKLLQNYEPYGSGESVTLGLEDCQGIFEDDVNDVRYSKLIVKKGYIYDVPIKYLESGDDKSKREFSYYIPLIRLSEVFLIAAECIFDTDAEMAVSILNNERKSRGLNNEISSDISKIDFVNELLKEARKDFIGEGQLLFMYKRLNLPVKRKGGEVEHGDNLVLPIPESESAI